VSREALSALRRFTPPRPALYGAALVLAGLAYRATFLRDGFSATDEGWLQSLGYRVATGQVPYRDFYYHFTPVSVYKEATLIALLGDAYTVMASRWVFAIEASLGSLLAFLVVLRFTSDLIAVLITLPTIFFSVQLYYFSNYTYDGEILLLGALVLLVESKGRRRLLAALAGALAALAFGAKPNFVAFVPVVLLAAWLGPLVTHSGHVLAAPLAGVRRLWPHFLLGFAIVSIIGVVYYAMVGAERQFLYQAFLLAEAAHPTGRRFALWQDLPNYAFSSPVAIPVGCAVGLLILAVCVRHVWVAWPALAGATGLAVWVDRWHEDPWLFLFRALILLLVVNFAATALATAVHGPWARRHRWADRWREMLPPPELPLFALALQYLAQFTFSGMRYSYIGAFLSIPVALLFVIQVGRAAVPHALRWRLQPALVASALGAWLVAGSVLVTLGTVYRDGPRAELIASFSTPKLVGVRTLPANAAQTDDLTAAVRVYSRPADRVLVLPDFAALYYLTDREPATRQTWYTEWMLTPGIVDETVADLQRNPPRVVFVQKDFLETDPSAPQLRIWPLYLYLRSTYQKVDTVSGIDVYVAPGQQASAPQLVSFQTARH
jgi:hypothetical protein